MTQVQFFLIKIAELIFVIFTQCELAILYLMGKAQGSIEKGKVAGRA